MREKCPECSAVGKKEIVNDFGSEKEIVYTCNNDEGFILPNCNVAQFTVVVDDMGKSKEVDSYKY